MKATSENQTSGGGPAAAGKVYNHKSKFDTFLVLQTVTIEESGKPFAVRSRCQGVCGKIFQAVGVALPPTIREL